MCLGSLHFGHFGQLGEGACKGLGASWPSGCFGRRGWQLRWRTSRRGISSTASALRATPPRPASCRSRRYSTSPSRAPQAGPAAGVTNRRSAKGWDGYWLAMKAPIRCFHGRPPYSGRTNSISSKNLNNSADRRAAPGTTWFCVRRNGAAKSKGWIGEIALADLPRRVGAERDDRIEVCVVERVRPVEPDRISATFYARARGIVGMEIELRGRDGSLRTNVPALPAISDLNGYWNDFSNMRALRHASSPQTAVCVPFHTAVPDFRRWR